MKSLLKGFAFIAISMFLFITCFAQDTIPATTPGTDTGGIFDWIGTHYVTVLSIVYALYEVVVRYIPTAKNYSIVGFIIKIIQFLVPNLNKTGTDHA